MPVKFIAEASSNHGQDLVARARLRRRRGRAVATRSSSSSSGSTEMFAPEILAQERQASRARRVGAAGRASRAARRTRCARREIEFSCTPFYLEAVKELEPYVAFYKIASYELLWHALLEACAATGKPVILSTGMATMPEITAAVATLKRAGAPRHHAAALRVGLSGAARRSQSFRHRRDPHRRTGVPVGWSDHTRSPAVIERAVHRWGASAVEFHLDLDGKGAEYASRPLLAAGGNRAGHRAHPRRRARRRQRLQGAVAAELPDREWRADPSDGLRPLRHVRATWEARAMNKRHGSARRRHRPGAHGLDAASGQGAEADRRQAAALARPPSADALPHAR